MAELSHKQESFVSEYLIDMNGTQAAIRAKYAKGSAKVTASRLLTNVNVIEALAVAMKSRSKRTEITADTVLTDLSEIFNADPKDILNDDWTLKPISGWPEMWRKALSGFDIQEMFEGRGDERKMVGLIKKIKWPDKLKTLELMGKHVNVGAFSDKLALTDPDGGPLEVSVMVALAREVAFMLEKAKREMD